MKNSNIIGDLTDTVKYCSCFERKKQTFRYGLPLFSGFPHKVCDLSAETVRYGRKEIEFALYEMPGLVVIREEYANKPEGERKVICWCHDHGLSAHDNPDRCAD